MSLYESLPDDQDGPPVAYPHMVGHDPAPDNLAQVSAVLRRLESPNNDMEGFRKGASYALWQLRELAGDAACREEIVSQGGLGAMIQVPVCPPSSAVQHLFCILSKSMRTCTASLLYIASAQSGQWELRATIGTEHAVLFVDSHGAEACESTRWP